MDALRIPILQLGPLLLISIQVELSDSLAEQLQDDILEEIHRTGAQGVLLDITALEMVDTFISRIISETAQMCSLMNARLVLVGIRPPVALTLMQMGLKLPGVDSAMDMQAGLQKLGYRLARIKQAQPKRGGEEKADENRYD